MFHFKKKKHNKNVSIQTEPLKQDKTMKLYKPYFNLNARKNPPVNI